MKKSITPASGRKQKNLRPDASPYRWRKGAWYGIYHEYRGEQKDPPMAKLSDWLDIPERELYQLWLVKKGEVASRLGIHQTRDYLLSTLKEKYLSGVHVKKTRDDYSRSLRYLEEACGEFDLRNWGEEHETRFTQHLKNLQKPNGEPQLKPGGINKHQRQLQWFLNWINNKRVVPNFSYWRITKEAVPPWDIDVFTREEVEDYKKQVLDYGNPIFIRAWMLAYYGIMRAEEIVYLPFDRINLETSKIQISRVDELNWHPKQHIHRYMGIHPELKIFLESDLKEERKWYLERAGKPHYSSAENLSQAFTRLRDKQFKWERKIDMLQALRRTGITHMVETGIPIEKVRYLAGHQRLSTTDKYYLFVDKQRATEDVNF